MVKFIVSAVVAVMIAFGAYSFSSAGGCGAACDCGCAVTGVCDCG